MLEKVHGEWFGKPGGQDDNSELDPELHGKLMERSEDRKSATHCMESEELQLRVEDMDEDFSRGGVKEMACTCDVAYTEF